MKSSVEGMLRLYLHILDDLQYYGAFTEDEARTIASIIMQAEDRRRTRRKQRQKELEAKE